ncbi:hypothetical protein EIP86_008173 [Pleurotus ostreatoroseus]|nr:hypothetical protein EIP86_008173 [Pleurotus ostreatoroseus]
MRTAGTQKQVLSAEAIISRPLKSAFDIRSLLEDIDSCRSRSQVACVDLRQLDHDLPERVNVNPSIKHMDNFLRNILNTSTALPYAAHLVVDVWQESVVEILNYLLSQLQSNPQFQVQLTVNIPDLFMTRIQDRQAIWSLFQTEQSVLLQGLPAEAFVNAYELFEANPAISRVTSLAYDIWTLILRLQIHCRYVTLVFRDNHFNMSLAFDDAEARQVSVDISTTVYFSAMSANTELGRPADTQVCQPFLICMGIFPRDTMQELEPRCSFQYDWDVLCTAIAKRGLRYPQLIAYPPAATLIKTDTLAGCCDPHPSCVPICLRY